MSKRIVICSDGTWNAPDRMDRGKVSPSNVAKAALAISPTDAHGTEQRLFYDKGVGTGRFDRLRGGAFGLGLSKNIEDAYRFLVEAYEPDDEIYLFGFSRGAYTVRSTAGLIRNCGLLKEEYAHKFPEAYDLYRRKGDESHPTRVEAQLFRKMYAWEVRIKFIGVWDTVGALGIPGDAFRFINERWEFHDVKLSSYVDNAYQALAIDERRRLFRPTIWEQQARAVNLNQKMEQVWFAGVHTNIGGGYQDSGLSDITFTWMKEKAEACGLAFDTNYIKPPINPNPLGEIRDSKTGPYNLLPDFIRPIGRGENSNESVHWSAVERMENATHPDYKPKNLVEYLEKGGKVTPR